MTTTPAPPDKDRPFAYLGVSSQVTAVGAYMCHLTLGRKTLRVLSREVALAYATELTWVVACAEYDAAILAQLKGVKGLEVREVGMVVRGVRADRRPILAAATHPILYTPIVSHRDFIPRITATCGETSWQWDLNDARQHVSQVLEVSAGVDMDASYLQYLRSAVGADPEMARNMVSLLREHMPGMTLVPE